MTSKLYTIDFKDETKAIITLCDESHPIFLAHFPNNPILPGFLHFDIVSTIFDLSITEIKKAKFLKTAQPNDTLRYERKVNNFTVFANEHKIASFSL
jgi:3-hydroxymyristoyl/3-hydroxydecanoyl-(acyl carrier protein) dehydratase